jgi:hypothetical protein
MLRLILFLFGFLVSSMWRPDDPPPENPPADPPNDPPDKPFLAFSSEKEHDDYLEKMLKERLERKDKKLQEDKERLERQAREQALKDQENWKDLAQTHAQTIEKLEKRIEDLSSVEGERDSKQERLESLEARLKGVIKPRLEAVPELYRPFVESMTVEEQAEWLEKNGEKLEVPANGRPAGSPRTGPPANRGGDKEADKEAREGQRNAGVSRI